MQRCIFVFAAIFLNAFARRLPDLYWNSSNPLLGLAENDVAEVDVNIMDSLAIYCPFFNETTPHNETETFVILRVSQSEYENCIPDGSVRVVGRCSKPYIPQTIHTVFRHFTPLPSGLEYTAGNIYYFISEPDKSVRAMKANRSGYCSTDRLRLKIRVHHSTLEGHSYRIRHRSGLHHRVHSHSVKVHSRFHSDKVNEPNQWIADNMKEIPVEDTPSEDEISVIKNKHRHLPTTRLPQVYDGKSTNVEALIHHDEVKLYEIHETDEYDALSQSSFMRPTLALIVIAAALTL